ncbi:MAG TPA: hypothetical protein VGC41_09690 [Kofleriaceae bacterium]
MIAIRDDGAATDLVAGLCEGIVDLACDRDAERLHAFRECLFVRRLDEKMNVRVLDRQLDDPHVRQTRDDVGGPPDCAPQTFETKRLHLGVDAHDHVNRVATVERRTLLVAFTRAIPTLRAATLAVVAFARAAELAVLVS